MKYTLTLLKENLRVLYGILFVVGSPLQQLPWQGLKQERNMELKERKWMTGVSVAFVQAVQNFKLLQRSRKEKKQGSIKH